MAMVESAQQVEAVHPTQAGGRGFLARLRRSPWPVKVSLVLLAVVLVAAATAPWLAPYPPTQQHLRDRLSAPGTISGENRFWLGTDHLGRDVLSRALHSLRLSILVASLGTMVGFLVGASLGLLSGLADRWVDAVVMFLIDAQLAVPFTLVALTAIAVFGSDLTVLIPIIGLAGWATYARVTRGQVLAVREALFVEAVRAQGGSRLRLALRHVLPNVTSPLIVLVTANFSAIMLLESSMSFLGLGVQPPDTSLGSMIGAGRNYLVNAWWISVAPAAILLAITMTTSLLGDWLRDTLDPTLRF